MLRLGYVKTRLRLGKDCVKAREGQICTRTAVRAPAALIAGGKLEGELEGKQRAAA